jgi:hypothetical protein
MLKPYDPYTCGPTRALQPLWYLWVTPAQRKAARANGSGHLSYGFYLPFLLPFLL